MVSTSAAVPAHPRAHRVTRGAGFSSGRLNTPGPRRRLGDLPAARRRTVMVLVGHESDGIPDEALPQLDIIVEIPMVGTGLSFNVAVAGSLVLYRLSGLI